MVQRRETATAVIVEKETSEITTLIYTFGTVLYSAGKGIKT